MSGHSIVCNGQILSWPDKLVIDVHAGNCKCPIKFLMNTFPVDAADAQCN